MISIHADFDEVFKELERAGLKPEILSAGSRSIRFRGVSADSRRIGKNLIFCAIAGTTHDGHLLLEGLANEVSLAIVERAVSLNLPDGFGVIKVSSSRAAWAQLASFFADHPTQKLKMVGITGTNGKTSTTWLLKEILQASGLRAGSIGTLGFYADEEHIESSHTTPDPDVLYTTLASFVTKGISHVVMEVSSHSLAQGKVWPILFDACAFTSFSQDHLDFHSSMESYLDAKLSLFLKNLKHHGFALIHSSVLAWPTAKRTLTELPQGLQTYCAGASESDYHIQSQSFFNQGFSRVCVSKSGRAIMETTLPMVGAVFCENFAAALILASQVLGKSLSEISSKISCATMRPVPGRLELVRAANKPWRPPIYVDYAHTPDALEKAISNLSSVSNSVTVVFGCGGDRDKKKRPLMGDIACRLAKRVFVTSDNPRSEDPALIISDIVKGIDGRPNIHIQPNRRLAIDEAINACGGQEPILIAGKGHEAYQIVGKQTLPFSDQAEAAASLSKAKRWLVFGAGVSGFSAANLLVEAGDKVAISADSLFVIPDVLAKRVSVVNPIDIVWSEIDRLVVSPGIPSDHAVIQKAKSLSKEVITEIDLGLDRYKGSIIAVTGTNGKSTTVAMAEYLLRSLAVPADACGNIGIAPTSIPIWQKPDSHCAILELSSYQLEGSMAWPAQAAAITSFSFDHISRHKTMDRYFEAKWRISDWLKPESIFLISQDAADYAMKLSLPWPSCKTIIICRSNQESLWPKHCEVARIDSSQIHYQDWSIDFDQLGIRGEHNYLNAFTAIMIASHTSKARPSEIALLMRNYKGLPYRCESIFDDGQRMIVNDSKSTNLESTLAALSVATRPAILLMGGQGKGESYRDLSLAKEKVAVLITFGASGHDIANEAPKGLATERFEKMAGAVLRALRLARDNKWDIIFSPGCASFDEFKNFEHRGAVFNQMVKDHFEH